MNLAEEAENSRRLDSLRAPLHQQFDSKQYAKCLPGLEALAEQRDLEAAIMAGHICFFGGGGVRKDYSKARRWLEVVNDDGYLPYAAYQLGIIYYKGLGLASDHRAAYRLFRRGGLRGHAKSLVMVGWMQRDGDGVLRKRRSGKAILFHCTRDKRLSIPMRALSFTVALGLI
jgi:TPR repeat protein